MSSGFVHLHVHTEFSLVDGIVRIEPLMASLAEQGMPAVAMTDQGNLFGMVKFYRAAINAGIKPIIGADIRVEDERAPDGYSRMTLLCADSAGYQCLTRLLTASYLEGQDQGVPIVRRTWLQHWSEGLIALSGAREGDVGRAVIAGDWAEAERRLHEWRELFGDRYYLEIQRTGCAGDEEQVHGAVALASRHAVPVVATNNVRFIEPGDYEAHEARVCIHEGRALDDSRRNRSYSEQQFLRTPSQMAEQFADIPEALANTVAIAKRCNLRLTLDQNVLPDFPVPEGVTVDAYLRDQAEAGLAASWAALIPADDPDPAAARQRYQDRLDHELAVIEQMGFPGYFLIVADFIRWARENDIPVGPGRGSGAGSLVAYALGITGLDPLRYDLLFERFLNPERVSMPDFDVDFCMERRDDVIEYVADRYGREKVSQIATHGTMAARAVVRDVGRVLGHPFGYVDRIAKLIPFEVGMTLDQALQQEEDLSGLYRDDDEVRTLLDMARKLEGMSRNVGKHAGGVVIAPSDLTDFAPLYCEPGGTGVATQFDKDDVEAVGLVKFDFLGLRTLTIIDWTVKAVNALRRDSGESPLVIEDIPMDDGAAFELIKRCQTTAVFQLESRGMKDLIRRLQPDDFEEIIALVALYRPGPLQSGMVEDFIERKSDASAIAYPTRALHHEALEPVLKPTYGVILYQEQVQRIAQVLGGYSLGGADLLRRAMGKKKASEMAKQRQAFLEGAKENGLSHEHAEGIFDLMEKFAGYGFNKSHSAAYALLSYQTAWLKAHYPAPFMAAVLSSDMDKTDKVVTLIEECRSMGLAVEPPDINRSDYAFRARDEAAIVYGLGAVKGVGEAAIEALVEARRQGGEYTDVFDLCRRIDLRRVNKRVLEALVRSGSLDSLAPNRATAMGQLPEALHAAEQQSRNRETGQSDLFGLAAAVGAEPAAESPASQPVAEWDESERLIAEKETLGLYLTGHPIEPYEAELDRVVTARLTRLASGLGQSETGDTGRRDGGPTVVAAGLVTAVRARATQSGGRIGLLTLDDRTARLDAILFPEAYRRYRHLLVKDQLVVVQGNLDYDDFVDGYRLSVDSVMTMSEAREAYARRLVLSVTASRAANGLIPNLREVLASYGEGSCPVWLAYQGETASAELGLGSQWRVRPTDELLQRLRELAAHDGVRVDYP
jgi:DNA polymerase-3 subunit alpha